MPYPSNGLYLFEVIDLRTYKIEVGDGMLDSLIKLYWCKTLERGIEICFHGNSLAAQVENRIAVEVCVNCSSKNNQRCVEIEWKTQEAIGKNYNHAGWYWTIKYCANIIATIVRFKNYRNGWWQIYFWGKSIIICSFIWVTVEYWLYVSYEVGPKIQR